MWWQGDGVSSQFIQQSRSLRRSTGWRDRLGSPLHWAASSGGLEEQMEDCRDENRSVLEGEIRGLYSGLKGFCTDSTILLYIFRFHVPDGPRLDGCCM